MAEPVRVPAAPAPERPPPRRRRRPRAPWPPATGSSTWTSGSYAPDPDILQSVPVELMFRYNFLPYRRHKGRLVLVMADPTDIPVVDELSLLLQTPIQPAVGTPGAIQEALKRGQGTQRVLEEASESFKIQLLRDDENGDDVLSIDKIQADASPDHPARGLRRSSTPSTAAPRTSTSRPATPRSSSSTASTACCSRP